MIGTLIEDAIEIARADHHGDASPRSLLGAVVLDGFAILVTHRMRTAARRLHVPGVGHALRLLQTSIFGVEIGKDVEIGRGVYFVHSLGIVIGGTAKIGDRVRFMGNNTVGTARDDGYPVIEDDVVVGCGARILGPVHVGKGAVIGANAVVLHDVPAGALAVGVPAIVRKGHGATYGADSHGRAA